MDAIVCIIGLITAAPLLFALRFYVGRRRTARDWQSEPRGGAGYNPIAEIYQPQIRHVIQVKEQRFGSEQDDEGDSPNPSPGRVSKGR